MTVSLAFWILHRRSRQSDPATTVDPTLINIGKSNEFQVRSKKDKTWVRKTADLLDADYGAPAS